MIVAVGVLVFVMCLALLEGGYYAYRNMRYPGAVQVHKRLKKLSTEEVSRATPDIMRRRPLSEIPWLHEILSHIPGVPWLDQTLAKANIRRPVGFFILLSLVLAVTGYQLCKMFLGRPDVALIVALALAAVPFFHVHMVKKKRMAKLYSQLPDVLDSIARAMRAGHAFSTGMKIIADEFDDPIGTEFGRVFDEINFGISVTDALKNLTRRVECDDLNFFVVSVILQRETGGNLSEILESLAYLIRERFKFYGKLRTLSAEGRLSALILSVLPFLCLVVIYLTTPQYILRLFTDPAGRVICIIALSMMITGILIMRKMIRIEV